jgi:hypothetical protein
MEPFYRKSYHRSIPCSSGHAARLKVSAAGR